MRYLTMKFTAFNIAKAEKQYGKELLDFINIGNLSVEKMLTLISIGNNLCSEEDAGNKLDNFLSDENNSLIDAYLQLLKELDYDTKILKRSGIKLSDIEASLNKQLVNDNKQEDKTDDPVIHVLKQEDRAEDPVIHVLKPDENIVNKNDGSISLG